MLDGMHHVRGQWAEQWVGMSEGIVRQCGARDVGYVAMHLRPA